MQIKLSASIRAKLRRQPIARGLSIPRHIPLAGSLIVMTSLIGCASQPSTVVTASDVTMHEQELRVSGFISEYTVVQIRGLSADHKFERIRVNVEAGEPLATMQLGYFIHREQLDLIVDQYCLGPCANYLFTAAAAKYFEPNAIVAWSDGALAESWTQQNQTFLVPGVRFIAEQYLDTFLRREIRFFERIGVDQDITVLGYNEAYGCADGNYRGFYYAIPDLLRFGVTSIHVAEGTWRTAFDHYPEQFCQVDLSNEFKSISF